MHLADVFFRVEVEGASDDGSAEKSVGNVAVGGNPANEQTLIQRKAAICENEILGDQIGVEHINRQ